MLNALKNFFNKTEIDDQNNNFNEKLELFCGIMVEAASVDGSIDKNEISKIESSLINIFKENPEDVNKILSLCVDKINEPNSLHSFTSRINKLISESEKIKLLEILWEIVFSDDVIHDYESNLIRRLAGLLYLSDISCGNAKKRALSRLETQKGNL